MEAALLRKMVFMTVLQRLQRKMVLNCLNFPALSQIQDIPQSIKVQQFANKKILALSLALNSILDGGSVHGCACHLMEHELSAYYDITHGHGLAIVTPRWLTYILNETTASAIYRLGTTVFGIENGLNEMEGAKKAIEALSSSDVEEIYKMCL